MPLQLITSAARGRPTVILQEEERPKFEVRSGQDMSFMLAMMNMMSQQNLATGQLDLQRDIAELQGMVTKESLKSDAFSKAIGSSIAPKIADLETKESLNQADFMIETDEAVHRGTQSVMAKFAARSIRSIGDRFGRGEIREGIVGIPEKIEKVLASTESPWVQMGMAQTLARAVNDLALSPSLGAEGQKMLQSTVQRGMPGFFIVGDPSFVEMERTRMAKIRQREFTEHFAGVKTEYQNRVNAFRGEDPSLPAIKRRIPEIAEEVISGSPFKPPETKVRFPSEIVRGEFTLPATEGVLPSLARGATEIPEKVGEFFGGRPARRVGSGRVLNETFPNASGSPQQPGLYFGLPSVDVSPPGTIQGAMRRRPAPTPGFTPGFRGSPMPFPAGGRILAEEVSEGGPNRPITDREFDQLLNENDEFRRMDSFINAFP